MAKIDIPGMDAIQSLKFGPGVIGRTAPIPIAFAVLVLAGIAAVHDRPELVLVLILVFLVAVTAYVGGVFWCGHRHPENALLEGGEAVAYKKLQNEQAAMSPLTIDVTSTPVANTAPPLTVTSRPGANQ